MSYGKIMDMAGLPASNTKSTSLTRNQELEEAIAYAVADGKTRKEIVARLAGRDPKKRAAVRQRLRYMSRNSPTFGAQMAAVAREEALWDLVPSIQALGRRAKRGRTDSIKLLAEITGFHNPRVQHEHTGEIKIKLEGMHRPERTVDSTAADITDADVVD